MINFSFEGNTIFVGNKSWMVKYAIEDAYLLNDKIIVLYQSDAQAENFRQFRNLVAFDLSGELLWTAEHPTNETADHYTKIIETAPLIVYSFVGFRCELNTANGRLMKTQFTK